MLALEVLNVMAVSLAGGGAAIGGVVTAVKYRNQWKPAREWAQDFWTSRAHLEEVVNSEGDFDAAASLRKQAVMLNRCTLDIKGHQSIRLGSGALLGTRRGVYGMALTSISDAARYSGNKWEPVPPLELDASRRELQTPSFLKFYTLHLRELADKAESEFTAHDDDFQASVADFARRHAAHLLLNYRTSPTANKVMGVSEAMKATARQKDLDDLRREVSNRGTDLLRTNLEAFDPAQSAITEARKVASKTPPKAITVAPSKVVASAEAPVEVAADLTEEEGVLVRTYRQVSHLLSEDDRDAGEKLLQKIVDAATLSVQAEKFSPAGRAQVVTLANQNRALAVAELSDIVEPTMSKDEAEAIYALRVDNKYLIARQDAKQTKKEVN